MSGSKLRPHDRQKGEGAKAWAAFCCYRDMGPDRSLAKVGRVQGKDRAAIERWSSRNAWVSRVETWQAEQDAIAEKARKAEIEDAVKRHTALARSMCELASQAAAAWQMAAVPPNSASIAGLAKAAVAIERQALGLADKAVELTGKDGGPIEHSHDVLKAATARVAAIVGDLTGEGADDGGDGAE